MSSSTDGDVRIARRLDAAEGTGVVRLEQRLDAEADGVWSAVTEPARLARWYGEIDGDLRAGGTFHARLHASGWDGTSDVTECEPGRSFAIVSRDPDEPDAHSTEVTLTPSGTQTVLVVEQRGLPLELLWAYGAGLQIHLEDLAAHLAGGDRCDSKTRFDELAPAYRELAAGVA